MKKRFLYLWIVIGAFLLFAFLYLPGLSRYLELRSEAERLSRDLAGLEREIQTLREEKELLEKDRVYLEKVIREELGLVKPGEMIYKLVPEKSPPEVSQTSSAPQSSLKTPRKTH